MAISNVCHLHSEVILQLTAVNTERQFSACYKADTDTETAKGTFKTVLCTCTCDAYWQGWNFLLYFLRIPSLVTSSSAHSLLNFQSCTNSFEPKQKTTIIQPKPQSFWAKAYSK